MPDQPQTRIQKVFGDYTKVWDNALDRWQRAVKEGQAGQYTPQRYVSDVISYWSDMMGGMVSPLTAVGYSVAPPVTVPILTLAVGKADDVIVDAISIPDPGNIGVVAADLARTANPNPGIPVQVSLSSDRRTLVVQLQGLKKLAPPSGDYQGGVVDRANPNNVIAQIIAKVA
jgi:hypothetical protein